MLRCGSFTVQGGPLSIVINGVISPISRVIAPVTPLKEGHSEGLQVTSPCITGRAPTLSDGLWSSLFMKFLSKKKQSRENYFVFFPYSHRNRTNVP